LIGEYLYQRASGTTAGLKSTHQDISLGLKLAEFRRSKKRSEMVVCPASYQFIRHAAKSRYLAFPRGENSLPPYSELSRTRPQLRIKTRRETARNRGLANAGHAHNDKDMIPVGSG
jgi:hypothetical protein